MMRYRARLTFHFVWMLLVTTLLVAFFVRVVGRHPIAGLALLVLGLVTMAGAGVRRVAWRLARPIEALAEASRRFGAGDLSTRVEVMLPRRHGPRAHRRPMPLDEVAALVRDWNEMAERIERLVGAQRELLANVSHELRSPLARIRMALELLPRAPEDEARLAAVATDIEELDRLIDDVLTASRLEAAPSLRPGDVDVQELLDSVRVRAAHDPLTRELELAVDCGVAALRGDAGLLRRALWNLVENAAKYGAPPIALSAALAGDDVLLAVSDGGPGIPAAEREHVQEPFVRLDVARTPGARAGVGLGLTIARRVAEAHGGALDLAAGREGRGLTATLRLPFTDPSSSAQTAATKPPHDEVEREAT